MAGPVASGTTRLGTSTQADAVLEIDDPAFLQALSRAFPALVSTRLRWRAHRRSIVAIAGACLVLVALTYLVAAYLPGIVAPLIPKSVQQSIGDRAVNDVIGLFGALEGTDAHVCNGKAGQAALDRLVLRLAGNRQNDVFKARVTNLKMVNALAVPGGRILATKGIIDFVGSAEEFAGVIAHEMGHALHRHPGEAVIREIGLRATLDFVVGTGLAGSTASVLLRTSYSRDAEREADDSGVRLLREAGISATGMVSLFERLEKVSPSLPEAFSMFSTHPRSADRAKRLAEAAAGPSADAMPAADWLALRKICDQE